MVNVSLKMSMDNFSSYFLTSKLDLAPLSGSGTEHRNIMSLDPKVGHCLVGQYCVEYLDTINAACLLKRSLVFAHRGLFSTTSVAGVVALVEAFVATCFSFCINNSNEVISLHVRCTTAAPVA